MRKEIQNQFRFSDQLPLLTQDVFALYSAVSLQPRARTLEHGERARAGRDVHPRALAEQLCLPSEVGRGGGTTEASSSSLPPSSGGRVKGRCVCLCEPEDQLPLGKAQTGDASEELPPL